MPHNVSESTIYNTVCTSPQLHRSLSVRPTSSDRRCTAALIVPSRFRRHHRRRGSSTRNVVDLWERDDHRRLIPGLLATDVRDPEILPFSKDHGVNLPQRTVKRSHEVNVSLDISSCNLSLLFSPRIGQLSRDIRLKKTRYGPLLTQIISIEKGHDRASSCGTGP